jgi:hypothetical protein
MIEASEPLTLQPVIQQQSLGQRILKRVLSPKVYYTDASVVGEGSRRRSVPFHCQPYRNGNADWDSYDFRAGVLIAYLPLAQVS